MTDAQMLSLKRFVNYIEMMIGDDKVEVTMIVAAGVICKEGENGEKMILLIQRSPDDHWPNHWEFPRGKCDKPIGEPVDKCAIREIKEECGLDVKVIDFIDKFQYLADAGKRNSICYNFLCRMEDPNQKIKLSKEHSSYRWVTQMGEVDLMVMPEQRKTLEKILSVDNPIFSTPENSFTQSNVVAEFLENI
jgi:mutator protein MutT